MNLLMQEECNSNLQFDQDYCSYFGLATNQKTPFTSMLAD
ncbi:hypothetical protein IIM_05055 [Bacillus cereus VD107]|nr:hypothetical protein IIM_05055 [Bacillus cereus VD107]